MNKLITTLILLIIFTPLQLTFAQTASEQKQPEVVLIMSSHTAKAKGDLLLSLSKNLGFTLDIFKPSNKSNDEIAARWSSAQLILLDGINPALSHYMFKDYQNYLSAYPQVPVVSLGDANNQTMNQGLTEEQRGNIIAYFNNAGRNNYQNLMHYLAKNVFNLSNNNLANINIAPPSEVPNVGLYHPKYQQPLTSNENEFFQWLAPKAAQPVIAIGIHRSAIDYEQQQIVDAMISGLEQKGAKAFGFYFEGEDQALNYTDLLMDDSAKSRVDLLINYRSLHYVEKRRAEFEKLGVPVLHALNYTEGSQADFEKDNAGVSPSLTPFFLVMPEDTGSTDPTIIAATEQGEKVAIAYQLQALVDRAFHHANLTHIANSEKKVATFIWNYPPGEKNIGAAFLDVPSSIENIATAMKAANYTIDLGNNNEKNSAYLIEAAGQLLRPYYRQEDTQTLIEKNLADYLPLSTYLKWFNTLPENVRQPIIERWGKPEASSMLKQVNTATNESYSAFVIPRIALGNLIILPQGVRGENAKEHANLYHSTKTPINHSYLAIYLYAREVFAANAYIHLGTHGSQEWLSGKERGLSVFDAPNLAIGNIPVFYPYIIDNVGEAMQAKRRGRATLISHLTPGFAKAGLYADIALLNEKIANFMMLEEGETKSNTQTEITTLAKQLNILTDLQLTEAQLATDFDNHLSTIQDHLNTLAQISQPLGIHQFGELPVDDHLITTILQILGDDFTERAAIFEQENGLRLSEARVDDRNVENLAALDGFQLVQAAIKTSAEPTLSTTLSRMDDSLKNDIDRAQSYWNNFQDIAEIKNLLRALDGKYIPVSYGGDPIRNPDAAPTGRNLIGFNPSKVPSKEAYEAGVTLMNQTIDAYVKKHNKFPKKLAFSLWSLETMRHQGALEAQVLHALGLKPKWDRQGNVVDTEVIPYSELKRPRIDVVVSATGLYRDAFPNVMLWLAAAIDKVAKMKEENNFVYQHANSLKAELIAKGESEENADYLSSIRIFSNETGNYGTGLAATSLASDTWETDDKLASLYLKRMGFAYGKDEKRWSESVANVAEHGLYNKVLSGTDAVIFSRSTNLYALMTNDDPFQYFGGIGLAVRHLDGKSPEMYVSNLRKKDQLKAQTLAEFVNQEMRSRYFHPRWIQAMQDSGYAGATAILDRMNNMWGWEVMVPEAIRDDQWQEFFEVYVEDKYQMNMDAFFKEHNAEALAQIIERMVEAIRKGYWQTDDKTKKKLVETYTELAATHDVATDNKKFSDFVDQQAQGFGLTPLSVALAQMTAQKAQAATPQQEATPAQAQTEQISGQKLEEQSKTQAIETDYTPMYWLMLIFLIGGLSNIRPPKKLNKSAASFITTDETITKKAA